MNINQKRLRSITNPKHKSKTSGTGVQVLAGKQDTKATLLREVNMVPRDIPHTRQPRISKKPKVGNHVENSRRA